MSNQPLRDELRNILTIVADFAKNNIENAVFDRSIIAEANVVPPDEVRNYLDELKILGLIQEDRKPTGTL